jgi:putative SOS response-associated peptidase YedK
MCYSAQVIEQYDEYVKAFGANIDLKTFARLYGARLESDRIKIPKSMDAWFRGDASTEAQKIMASIAAFEQQQANKLEQELFKQKARLADAQRTLLTKTTKAATEANRISSNKIEWALSKLADLRRTERRAVDSRIFPGYYAPVMVMENGQKVVKPMRYQCRPAGKPAMYDSKYPGTYNARRDNLEGFWKDLFGYGHGIMIVNAFYEHVSVPKRNGDGWVAGDETENVILEFKPRPTQDMLVACLWSHWTGPGEPALDSFAAITDEPPAEVSAAGHDRCIIPIKPEHVDAWLNPDPTNLRALSEILDDRERPYYEHRLAA